MLAITPSARAIPILRELNKGRGRTDKIKAREFRARFTDLDFEQLPTSGEADKARKARYHKDRQEQKVRAMRAAEEKARHEQTR